MGPIPETLATKRNQYEPAFILLVGEFLRVCEFIELTDTHLDVYSHRLYEILLRACTEFESLCREILTAHGFLPARLRGRNAVATRTYRVLCILQHPAHRLADPLKPSRSLS
jgi:hypothetical protein